MADVMMPQKKKGGLDQLSSAVSTVSTVMNIKKGFADKKDEPKDQSTAMNRRIQKIQGGATV